MLRSFSSRLRNCVLSSAALACLAGAALLPMAVVAADGQDTAAGRHSALSLSAIADGLESQLTNLRNLIAITEADLIATPPDQGQAPANASDNAAPGLAEMLVLRDQVELLTARNKALMEGVEQDQAQRDTLLKGYSELSARYDALMLQRDDSEDSAVQLETALMLIDNYEETISQLNVRVAELEEKYTLLLRASMQPNPVPTSPEQ